MTGAAGVVAHVAQGGHLTRRPYLVREPVFRQAMVTKTSCLLITIRVIAKQHLKFSYRKNLRHHLTIIVAVVVVVVVTIVVIVFVVVHGCLSH